MMDFDLRAKKLQQQADARILDAKKKLEREQRLMREQKLREEKQLELSILQKEKVEQEKLRLYEEEQLLLQKSGGILFSLRNLIPYEIEGEDDKIILPESSLLSLDQKNAFSHGHLCFELSSSSSSSSSTLLTSTFPTVLTHSGVREFSAENGMIGLPIKVIHSLARKHTATINDIGTIDLHYRKLNKIKSVKFAPHSDEFFSLYKHNIKNVLEKNLKLHTCLSLGDILSVWYRGKSFFVTVSEMSPEPYGSLIDSDVEVEFIDYGTHLNTQEKDITSSSEQPTSTFKNNLFSTTNTLSNGIHTVEDISNSKSTSVPITSNEAIKTNRLPYPSTTILNQANNQSSILTVYDLEPEPVQPQPGADDSNLIYLRIRISLKDTAPVTLSRRFVKYQYLKQLFYFIARETNVPIGLLKVTVQSLNKVFTIDSTNNSNSNSNGSNEVINPDEEQQKDCNKMFEELKFSKREMIMVSSN